ncbi:MAG: GNAT family N-acetyltransferase [Myxococcaceae bacterium]|nr:MAG: GNAT family N-acetyltransferase [Myxococcaceae bacterium]
MDGPGAGPAVVIRRLGAGDESVLALLARDDADFDLDGGAGRRRPLTAASARSYLADPHVLHWTAWAGEEVVGSLVCHVLPMRKQPARELVLYEIGVRSAWRYRGVGRQLISRMTDWMRAEGVLTAWVLADNPDAERFYEACGFGPGSGPATYLELGL